MNAGQHEQIDSDQWGNTRVDGVSEARTSIVVTEEDRIYGKLHASHNVNNSL